MVQITKVCYIGAGYVGGTSAAVLALKCPKIDVTVVDKCEHKISKWNSGNLPIYEHGLLPIVNSCRYKNLFFTTDIKQAIVDSDLIFITVNTPTLYSTLGKFGRTTNLKYVEIATREIAKYSTRCKIVVQKSTVPVHTSSIIKKILDANKLNGMS